MSSTRRTSNGIHVIVLALTLAPALVACATSSDTPVATDSPSPSAQPAQEPSNMTCNADAARQWVGATASDAIERDAKTATGAAAVRVIGPDDMVTMDFREDRLNIRVDAQRRILSFDCG